MTEVKRWRIKEELNEIEHGVGNCDVSLKYPSLSNRQNK